MQRRYCSRLLLLEPAERQHLHGLMNACVLEFRKVFVHPFVNFPNHLAVDHFQRRFTILSVVMAPH